ncbi:DUF3108 domain-containing protein [Pseudovibrio flavus]|uniref:DUF3108 domain-containing protein n=1 Tax=Pseudovibrio flavus TaxID=2529854 RepID=UPI00211C4E4D|nr:DUF3108 domain-containing protein [Pseudovibrio flavus]
MCVCSLSTAALGKTNQVDGNYNISIAGITIGKGSMSLALRNNAYSAKVSMEPAGIGTLFSTGTGAAEARGWISGSRILPSRYEMVSQASERNFHVDLRQGSGHIRNELVRPRFKPSATRIKVTNKHRKNAMDPLSAALMPVVSRGDELSPDACNRTLPIYDGWTRFDIEMTYKKMREVSGNGYDGPVIVCKARWIPVAGHRPERKSVQLLARSNNMEVWLAPTGHKKVLIPYRISIPTGTGSLVVQAQELGLPNGHKQSAAR